MVDVSLVLVLSYGFFLPKSYGRSLYVDLTLVRVLTGSFSSLDLKVGIVTKL